MNAAAAPKYCPGCGTRLQGDERHCRECGTRVAPAAASASAPPPSATFPPASSHPPAPRVVDPYPPAVARPLPTVPSSARPPQSPPPSRPGATQEKRKAGAWTGLVGALAVAAAGGLAQVDWGKHLSFLSGTPPIHAIDGTYACSSGGVNLLITLDGNSGSIDVGPYHDRYMRVGRHGDTVTMSGGTISDADGKTVDAGARSLFTGGDETNVFTLTDDGQTLTSKDTDASGNRLVFNKQP